MRSQLCPEQRRHYQIQSLALLETSICGIGVLLDFFVGCGSAIVALRLLHSHCVMLHHSWLSIPEKLIMLLRWYCIGQRLYWSRAKYILLCVLNLLLLGIIIVGEPLSGSMVGSCIEIRQSC